MRNIFYNFVFCFGIVAFVAAAVLISVQMAGIPLTYAQRPDAPRQTQQREGRVIERRLNELHRHPTPRPNPPGQPPRHRHPGHHPRWSPIFQRWIYVPVNVSPAQVVLPQTYQLPATVQVYEDQQSGAAVTCPHCNRELRIVVFPD